MLAMPRRRDGHQAKGRKRALRLTHPPGPNIFAAMSTLTVSLPEPLAERLRRASRSRSVTQDSIVRQALEQVLPQDADEAGQSVFASLAGLVVNDPESPADLATNPAHMEGFGVSRSA